MSDKIDYFEQELYSANPTTIEETKLQYPDLSLVELKTSDEYWENPEIKDKFLRFSDDDPEKAKELFDEFYQQALNKYSIIHNDYFLASTIPGTEVLEEPNRWAAQLPASENVQLFETHQSLDGSVYAGTAKTGRLKDPRQTHLEYGLELEDENGEKYTVDPTLAFEEVIGEKEYRHKDGRNMIGMAYKRDGTAGLLPIYEGQFGQFADWEWVSGWDYNNVGDMAIEADPWDFLGRGAWNFGVNFVKMFASLGAVTGASLDAFGRLPAWLLSDNKEESPVSLEDFTSLVSPAKGLLTDYKGKSDEPPGLVAGFWEDNFLAKLKSWEVSQHVATQEDFWSWDSIMGGVVDVAFQIATGKIVATAALKGTKLAASGIRAFQNVKNTEKAIRSGAKVARWYDDVNKYTDAAQAFNKVALRNQRKLTKLYFAGFAAADSYENALAHGISREGAILNYGLQLVAFSYLQNKFNIVDDRLAAKGAQKALSKIQYNPVFSASQAQLEKKVKQATVEGNFKLAGWLQKTWMANAAKQTTKGISKAYNFLAPSEAGLSAYRQILKDSTKEGIEESLEELFQAGAENVVNLALYLSTDEIRTAGRGRFGQVGDKDYFSNLAEAMGKSGFMGMIGGPVGAAFALKNFNNSAYTRGFADFHLRGQDEEVEKFYKEKRNKEIKDGLGTLTPHQKSVVEEKNEDGEIVRTIQYYTMQELESDPDLAHLEKISQADFNYRASLADYSHVKNLVNKLGGADAYDNFLKENEQLLGDDGEGRNRIDYSIREEIGNLVHEYNDILFDETNMVFQDENVTEKPENMSAEEEAEWVETQKKDKKNQAFSDNKIKKLGELKQKIKEIADGEAIERHFFRNSFRGTLFDEESDLNEVYKEFGSDFAYKLFKSMRDKQEDYKEKSTKYTQQRQKNKDLVNDLVGGKITLEQFSDQAETVDGYIHIDKESQTKVNNFINSKVELSDDIKQVAKKKLDDLFTVSENYIKDLKNSLGKNKKEHKDITSALQKINAKRAEKKVTAEELVEFYESVYKENKKSILNEFQNNPNKATLLKLFGDKSTQLKSTLPFYDQKTDSFGLNSIQSNTAITEEENKKHNEYSDFLSEFDYGKENYLIGDNLSKILRFKNDKVITYVLKGITEDGEIQKKLKNKFKKYNSNLEELYKHKYNPDNFIGLKTLFDVGADNEIMTTDKTFADELSILLNDLSAKNLDEVTRKALLDSVNRDAPIKNPLIKFNKNQLDSLIQFLESENFADPSIPEFKILRERIDTLKKLKNDEYKDNPYIGLPSSELNKLRLIADLAPKEYFGKDVDANAEKYLITQAQNLEQNTNLSAFFTIETLSEIGNEVFNFEEKNPEFDAWLQYSKDNKFEIYDPLATILNYKTTFNNKVSPQALLNNIRAKRTVLESFINMMGKGIAGHLIEIKVQRERIADEKRAQMKKDSEYFVKSTAEEREPFTNLLLTGIIDIPKIFDYNQRRASKTYEMSSEEKEEHKRIMKPVHNMMNALIDLNQQEKSAQAFLDHANKNISGGNVANHAEDLALKLAQQALDLHTALSYSGLVRLDENQNPIDKGISEALQPVLEDLETISSSQTTKEELKRSFEILLNANKELLKLQPDQKATILNKLVEKRKEQAAKPDAFSNNPYAYLITKSKKEKSFKNPNIQEYFTVHSMLNFDYTKFYEIYKSKISSTETDAKEKLPNTDQMAVAVDISLALTTTLLDDFTEVLKDTVTGDDKKEILELNKNTFVLQGKQGTGKSSFAFGIGLSVAQEILGEKASTIIGANTDEVTEILEKSAKDNDVTYNKELYSDVEKLNEFLENQIKKLENGDDNEIIDENISSIVLDEASYIYYNDHKQPPLNLGKIRLEDIINNVNKIQELLRKKDKSKPFKLILMGDKNQNGNYDKEKKTPLNHTISSEFIKNTELNKSMRSDVKELVEDVVHKQLLHESLGVHMGGLPSIKTEYGYADGNPENKLAGVYFGSVFQNDLIISSIKKQIQKDKDNDVVEDDKKFKVLIILSDDHIQNVAKADREKTLEGVLDGLANDNFKKLYNENKDNFKLTTHDTVQGQEADYVLGQFLKYDIPDASTADIQKPNKGNAKKIATSLGRAKSFAAFENSTDGEFTTNEDLKRIRIPSIDELLGSYRDLGKTLLYMMGDVKSEIKEETQEEEEVVEEEVVEEEVVEEDEEDENDENDEDEDDQDNEDNEEDEEDEEDEDNEDNEEEEVTEPEEDPEEKEVVEKDPEAKIKQEAEDKYNEIIDLLNNEEIVLPLGDILKEIIKIVNHPVTFKKQFIEKLNDPSNEILKTGIQKLTVFFNKETFKKNSFLNYFSKEQKNKIISELDTYKTKLDNEEANNGDPIPDPAIVKDTEEEVPQSGRDEIISGKSSSSNSKITKKEEEKLDKRTKTDADAAMELNQEGYLLTYAFDSSNSNAGESMKEHLENGNTSNFIGDISKNTPQENESLFEKLLLLQVKDLINTFSSSAIDSKYQDDFNSKGLRPDNVEKLKNGVAEKLELKDGKLQPDLPSARSEFLNDKEKVKNSQFYLFPRVILKRSSVTDTGKEQIYKKYIADLIVAVDQEGKLHIMGASHGFRSGKSRKFLDEATKMNNGMTPKLRNLLNNLEYEEDGKGVYEHKIIPLNYNQISISQGKPEPIKGKSDYNTADTQFERIINETRQKTFNSEFNIAPYVFADMRGTLINEEGNEESNQHRGDSFLIYSHNLNLSKSNETEAEHVNKLLKMINEFSEDTKDPSNSDIGIIWLDNKEKTLTDLYKEFRSDEEKFNLEYKKEILNPKNVDKITAIFHALRHEINGTTNNLKKLSRGTFIKERQSLSSNSGMTTRIQNIWDKINFSPVFKNAITKEPKTEQQELNKKAVEIIKEVLNKNNTAIFSAIKDDKGYYWEKPENKFLITELNDPNDSETTIKIPSDKNLFFFQDLVKSLEKEINEENAELLMERIFSLLDIAFKDAKDKSLENDDGTAITNLYPTYQINKSIAPDLKNFAILDKSSEIMALDNEGNFKNISTYFKAKVKSVNKPIVYLDLSQDESGGSFSFEGVFSGKTYGYSQLISTPLRRKKTKDIYVTKDYETRQELIYEPLGLQGIEEKDEVDLESMLKKYSQIAKIEVQAENILQEGFTVVEGLTGISDTDFVTHKERLSALHNFMYNKLSLVQRVQFNLKLFSKFLDENNVNSFKNYLSTLIPFDEAKLIGVTPEEYIETFIYDVGLTKRPEEYVKENQNTTYNLETDFESISSEFQKALILKIAEQVDLNYFTALATEALPPSDRISEPLMESKLNEIFADPNTVRNYAKSKLPSVEPAEVIESEEDNEIKKSTLDELELQDGELVQQLDDNIKEVKAEIIESVSYTTMQAEIAAKEAVEIAAREAEIAEIESDRQKELDANAGSIEVKREEVSFTHPDIGEQSYQLQYLANGDIKYKNLETGDKGLYESGSSRTLEQVLLAIKDGNPLPLKTVSKPHPTNKADKINAKYDAELAALETTTTDVEGANIEAGLKNRLALFGATAGRLFDQITPIDKDAVKAELNQIEERIREDEKTIEELKQITDEEFNSLSNAEKEKRFQIESSTRKNALSQLGAFRTKASRRRQKIGEGKKLLDEKKRYSEKISRVLMSLDVFRDKNIGKNSWDLNKEKEYREIIKELKKLLSAEGIKIIDVKVGDSFEDKIITNEINGLVGFAEVTEIYGNKGKDSDLITEVIRLPIIDSVTGVTLVPGDVVLSEDSTYITDETKKIEEINAEYDAELDDTTDTADTTINLPSIKENIEEKIKDLPLEELYTNLESLITENLNALQKLEIKDKDTRIKSLEDALQKLNEIKAIEDTLKKVRDEITIKSQPEILSSDKELKIRIDGMEFSILRDKIKDGEEETVKGIIKNMWNLFQEMPVNTQQNKEIKDSNLLAIQNLEIGNIQQADLTKFTEKKKPSEDEQKALKSFQGINRSITKLKKQIKTLLQDPNC